MNLNQFIDLSHIADSDEEGQESQPALSFCLGGWLGNPVAKPSPRFRDCFIGLGLCGQSNVHTWTHNPVADDLAVVAQDAGHAPVAATEGQQLPFVRVRLNLFLPRFGSVASPL